MRKMAVVVVVGLGDRSPGPAIRASGSRSPKCRQHGFHAVVDSEAMLVRLLEQFRAGRIVP